MGNSLLRWAGLGIRKVQTQGEKLLEAGYCGKFQPAYIPMILSRGTKANSFVEATLAFVEKVPSKEPRGLASL